jgi:hypothetical protein
MATDQTGKIIPGISLSALDGVEDAKVREVLRALVGTHNVRNNLAGSGSEAFITTRQTLEATRTRAPSEQATVPPLIARYMRGVGGTYPAGSLSGPLGTMHITLDRPAAYQLMVTWSAASAVNAQSRIEVHTGDGALLLSRSETLRAGYVRSYVASGGFDLPPGEHVLTLHAGNDGRGTSSLHAWGVLAMPVRR